MNYCFIEVGKKNEEEQAYFDEFYEEVRYFF